MLVTYRSDELDRRHPLAPLLQAWRRSRVAELVTLSPLGETEIAEMITAILDHDEIGPEFRDLMLARTEGNPFVLEEMLREAIDRGDVFRTADGWDRRALAEVRIPETVRDTILLRFARLDPAEAEVAAGRRRARPYVRLRDSARRRRPSGRDRAERARNRRRAAMVEEVAAARRPTVGGTR